MPYIKKDELKILLRSSFISGVASAYGFDHENSLCDQEEEAFEKYYEKLSERQKTHEVPQMEG